MAERFYVNRDVAPGPFVLAGPEGRHLATVCRARPGDRVCLFNGDGLEYPAEVIVVRRRQVDLMVGAAEHPQREVGFRLEVASPLPKGDRAQFLVEKLTELGVTSFVPLETQRSVIEPRETKQEKLRRHVIESSKQCGRNALMKVASPVEWDIYCRRAHLPQLRVLGHPGRSHNSWPASVDVALAVGPEGGFTDAEVALARAASWGTVGLGPRVLRVETAALVLAALSAYRLAKLM